MIGDHVFLHFNISAVNQLVSFSDDIGRALDSGKEMWFKQTIRPSLACWAIILTGKNIELRGPCYTGLNIIDRGRLSYTKDTDWGRNKAGVSQDSILGPLLFISFINDIVSDIGASDKLFANDTSIKSNKTSK